MEDLRERTRSVKKLIIVIVVLVVVAGGWIGYKKTKTKRDNGVSYEPVELVRGRIESVIESTGIVEPRNRLEIKPPVGGRVEQVLVQEGDEVKAGQIIAWLSSTERAALLDAARAEGEAALKKWESAYKPTPVMAPLDGTIIARNAEPGQTVTSQDILLVLSDRLILTAQVDETDIGRIAVGQKTAITLDAYRDTPFEGVVSQIAYEAVTVNNVTIYKVEVAPTNPPSFIKSGMTASTRFLVRAAEDALTLPSDAVDTEKGKSYVLVDDGNPKTPPEKREVETGLNGGEKIEILKGLEQTDQIVKQSFKLPGAKAETASPFMPNMKGGARPPH